MGGDGLGARLARLPAIGLFTSFFSASLFGLCNVIVKGVESVDPFTIAFYRFIGIALPAFSILIFKSQDPFPKGKVWMLVVRSVMGASNLCVHFYGVKHMPIADANMISAASPIWTVIMSRIFLKEPMKPFDIVNVIITLTGILFIIRPPFVFGYDESFEFDQQYYIAAVIVFCGTFMQAGVYIFLRALKGIHYSVTLSMFGTIGTLEASILMSTLGRPCLPACGATRLMMVGIGLLSFIGQICLTISLQLEEAGKVSIMRKAGDILFAFLFQIFIFQDYPGVWSIIGAILVSVAVFFNGSNKVVDNLPDDHIVKTKYLKTCYGKQTAASEVPTVVESDLEKRL